MKSYPSKPFVEVMMREFAAHFNSVVRFSDFYPAKISVYFTDSFLKMKANENQVVSFLFLYKLIAF